MMAEDYQLRVIEEKREIDKKIIALTSFIHSEKSPLVKITDAESERLERQLYIMIEYSKVLRQRIYAFEV